MFDEVKTLADLNEGVLTGENRDNFSGLLRSLSDAADDLRRLLATSNENGLHGMTR